MTQKMTQRKPMTNKIEMPDFSKSFKFKCHPSFNDSTIYTYNGATGTYHSPNTDNWYNMTREHVKKNIAEGKYIVIPGAILPNNISKETKTAFEQIVKNLYHRTPESLLAQMKAFTTLTGASIFIQPDGEYEVYYDDPFLPAKAKSDEEMKKLIDAIAVLHVATYGD